MSVCKKILILMFGVLVSLNVFAASVEITFDPVRPVVNEPFHIIFNVSTSQKSAKEPYVSFELSRGEVKSKQLMGTTTNATVINGRYQLSKAFRYLYEAETDRSGTLTVKNIEVDIDGEVIKPSPKRVKVFTKRQKPSQFFLQAETNVSKAYIGEGIDLKYYLYSRVPVSPLEIEIFPKLKGFIKRFHRPQNNTESVEIDGVIYRRAVQYSARIYPEKEGELKIDPLKLKVQYSDRRNNKFGQFGFAFGRRRNKSLRSKPIKIQVATVPAKNVPKNFTGLIGQHSFKFSINKSKFLVNEVIEMKLVVDGPGALEKLDMPQLIIHPEVESFDIKGELNETSQSRASKTFEFTYLPRGNVELPEQIIDFHYFDSRSQSFKSSQVKVPAISVRGGAVGQTNNSGNTTNAANEKDDQVDNYDFEDNRKPKIVYHLLAPNFTSSDESMWITKFNIILMVILLAIIAVIVSMMKGFRLFRKYPKEVKDSFNDIKANGLNFGTLSRFLRQVSVNEPVHLPLQEQIQGLAVSDAAKSYFSQCVAQSEKKNYGRNRNKNRIKVETKYFKEALKLVELQ